MANIDVKEIGAAIKQICEEKGIPFESVIATIEAALAVAYRKEMAKKGKDIRAEFNPHTGTMRIFEVSTVVDDTLYDEYLKEKEIADSAEKIAEHAEKMYKKPEMMSGKVDGVPEEEQKPRFNPKTDIALREAKAEDESIEIGDEIRIRRAPHSIRFAAFEKNYFFKSLEDKFALK